MRRQGPPSPTSRACQVGEAAIVRHMHNVRGPGGGGGSIVSTGAANVVGRQQILFDFPDQTVNVWQVQLGVLTPPGAATAR